MKEHIFRKEFGKRVRLARKEAHLTQKELHHELLKLGIKFDSSCISKIESGIRKTLDYELLALSVILSKSINWFFDFENEHYETSD